MSDKSLTGRKPPEEINENAKFKELKDLIEKIFNITKITNVNPEYNRNNFKACLKVSELSKDIKFVKVFLKFLSYMSIKKIIENRKYRPPIHWLEDLHKIKLWSISLIFSNILKPVDVKPEIASKYESKNVKL